MADWSKSAAVQANDEKEKDLEDKRKKVLEASKFDPYYQRYGLFSFPGPLNIGDNTCADRLLRHRNPNGTVATQSKNFLTQPLKPGSTPEVFFSTPPYYPGSYVPVKPLKDRLKSPEKNEFQKSVGPFYPSGAFTERPLPYEYQPIGTLSTPNLRTGPVLTSPKNFLTSGLKKGHAGSTPGLLFGRQYPHLPDPYERKGMMLREERAREKAKDVSPGAFRGKSCSGNNFSSAQELYYEERSSRELLPRTNVRATGRLAPWRPNNPAKTSVDEMTLGKFPEHVPSPMAEVGSSVREELPWRCTHNGLTRPTPALTTMLSDRTYNR